MRNSRKRAGEKGATWADVLVIASEEHVAATCEGVKGARADAGNASFPVTVKAMERYGGRLLAACTDSSNAFTDCGAAFADFGVPGKARPLRIEIEARRWNEEAWGG